MKGEIQKSWETRKWGLIRSMLGMGNLMQNIEPILLIADYYGEKHAMYFTFLIHHIAMLFIPTVFGLFLWAYHIYLASQHELTEDSGKSGIDKYFSILDTEKNYVFLYVLATWSTIYIESWKRKQNTVKYIWASEERIKDIKSSEKRDQKGATYFIEKVSGKKTLAVLKETPIKNLLKTLSLILLSMAIALGIWYLSMRQLGKWLL
jgi:hypothetical protein